MRAALLAVLVTIASAQAPPPPVSGSAGLELLLRKLTHTGVVMIVNAHPDDEPNALIAMLAHGLGLRVVELTLTRGEGGQNDLGYEQGLALSVLRTEELLAVHRIDGAEQLFARAVDFGYSFSVEETFAKWGKDEILADIVRLVRMVRPDVIITMSPEGDGGGQHHQASARLAREAFDKAADPKAFPEQLEAGLHTWQASRLYYPFGGPPAADDAAASRPESRVSESRSQSRPQSRRGESQPESRHGDVTIDTDVFDSALGCTYHELGTRARGMHKSQGMARLGALPGPSVQRYRLGAEAPGTSSGSSDSLVSGLRLGLGGAARLSATHGAELVFLDFLYAIESRVLKVRDGASTLGPAATLSSLVEILARIRKLRDELGTSPEWPWPFEGVQQLAQKEADAREAIALAAGLRIEAIADASVVVPGQEIKVTVYLANRLAPDLEFAGVTLQGFDPSEGGCATRPSGPLPPRGLVKCENKVRIPKDAHITSAHWKALPSAARSEWEPDVPFGAPFRPTPFRAKVALVVCGQRVVYDVPVESRDGSDVFAGEKRDELLVVPAQDADYQRIEYGHTRRRHLLPASRCVRPTLDFKLDVAKIGWVRGVGDRLDEAIHCFGTTVEPLDEGIIKAGGLERYPAIVVGNRALELRPEIRAVAPRLREYAEKGGTLVIFYQRSGLDENTIAPYPAKTGGGRVTDETAPVTVLVPTDPAFNVPNKLSADDWAGWVSERGRSFLETKDPHYVDLIEMADPFELNKGPKRGILVEARVGRGRWIYCGLALSRQLDEGVPGAYRLLANLLSLRGEAP